MQFVTDQNGDKTAVLIPIAEWEKISKQLTYLLEYEEVKKGTTRKI
ncbi:MAG: hypothetical protein ACPG5B_12270 [Chitinophagales bacterium]